MAPLCAYVDVVDMSSSSLHIVVPLSRDAKPLAAHVRIHTSNNNNSNNSTGLLASYYDVESHAWVVRHSPLYSSNNNNSCDAEACVARANESDNKNSNSGDSSRRQRGARGAGVTVRVRVVVLIDPADEFDVRMTTTQLREATDNSGDVYALQQRSRLYRGMANEDNSNSSDDDDDDEAHEAGYAPPVCARACVQLLCTLPQTDAFVLTGGGFMSDYPVCNSAPTLPRAREALHTAWLLRQQEPQSTVSEAAATEAHTTNNNSSNNDCEYTAWSVTAAANAALTCYAIGLRFRCRRRPLRDNGDCGRDDGMHSYAAVADAASARGHDKHRSSSSTALVATPAATRRRTLQLSTRTRHDNDDEDGKMLEALTLRQGIRVCFGSRDSDSGSSAAGKSKMARQTWQLELPSPYRCFVSDFSLADLCDDAMQLRALAYYYDDDVLDALL